MTLSRLYQDAGVSCVVISYKGVPHEFIEELSNSEPVIFPPLSISVADFLDKSIPLLPDTSNVPLSWSHKKPQQSLLPALLLGSPCFATPISGNHLPIFHNAVTQNCSVTFHQSFTFQSASGANTQNLASCDCLSRRMV